jgi:hypothetical protein
MNSALSLPRLGVLAGKFQVGGDADPESTHAAQRANESFAFQLNLVGGEWLLNKEFWTTRMLLGGQWQRFETKHVNVTGNCIRLDR